MMKKLLCLMMTICLAASVALCFAEESGAPDLSTGTPWLASTVEGAVTEETFAELKDDFMLAVNRDKILAMEIPEGYSMAGTLVNVDLKLKEDMKNMFLGEEPESHDAKLAYHLFWLMMDWESRNARGVAPLKEMTDAVEDISSLEALTAYLTETPYEKQFACFWIGGKTSNFEDSDRYILGILPGGLLLEDSGEYTKLSAAGRVRKEAVTELVRKMLAKLGYSAEEAEQKIENCFTLETMLAEGIKTEVEKRDASYLASTLNHYSREELKEAEGKAPILERLEQCQGYPEADVYLVREPDSVRKVSEVYTEENLTLMKDFMIVHGAVDYANDLDRECYEWHTTYKNTLTGTQGTLDDETMVADTVSDLLVWPVAQLYTENYLKQEDKDRISNMIDQILEAYHGIIREADFLTEETREEAIDKLDHIHKYVLYPDDWEIYSCAELNFASREEGGTLWEALRQIESYEQKKDVEDYQKPVEKDLWPVPPQLVNAGYGHQTNGIYIFGAFAQGDIYHSDMSNEELYGKLGASIGHEISHAFDAKGAQFDKDGNMANWWSEEDMAVFTQRNEKLVSYINSMHPWAGQDLHGEIMKGEVCADMAGIKVMLRIAAQEENFDYDAFFRAYCDLWLEKVRLESAIQDMNDPHPMSYLRVNICLQQYDEFLNCYGIKEGDGMYLAPEDRVNVW